MRVGPAPLLVSCALFALSHPLLARSLSQGIPASIGISIVIQAGSPNPEAIESTWSSLEGVRVGDAQALQDSAKDLRTVFDRNRLFDVTDENSAKLTLTVTNRAQTFVGNGLWIPHIFYRLQAFGTGYEFEDVWQGEPTTTWRDLAASVATRIELWAFRNDSRYDLFAETALFREANRMEVLALVAWLGSGDIPGLLEAAEGGDAKSQLILGLAYQKGIGVEQDASEAVRWYQKAAEQGHPMAQCNLACSYAFGEGVRSDMKEAARWYLKAAESHFWPAQFNLGFLYDRGFGVRRDEDDSLHWYREAAVKGFAPAQFELGTPEWLRDARDAGHALASYRLAEMYFEGSSATLVRGVQEETGFFSMFESWGSALRYLTTGSAAKPDDRVEITLFPFRENWSIAADQGQPLAALRLAEYPTEVGALARNRSKWERMQADPLAACVWLQVAGELEKSGDWMSFVTEEETVTLQTALSEELPRLKGTLNSEQLTECDGKVKEWMEDYRTRAPTRVTVAVKAPLLRHCLIAESLSPSAGPDAETRDPR